MKDLLSRSRTRVRSSPGFAVHGREDRGPRCAVCMQRTNLEQFVSDLDTLYRRLSIFCGNRSHKILTAITLEGETNLVEIVGIQFRLTHPIGHLIRIVNRDPKGPEDIAAQPADNGKRIFLGIPVDEIPVRTAWPNCKRANLPQVQ